MPLLLSIDSGPLADTTFPIRAGEPLRIGRTREASCAIPHDELLSRVHFELQQIGPDYRLRDLKSSNGTRLNGVPVTESVVRAGDEITAGGTRFSIRAGQDAPSAGPQAADPNSSAVHDSLLAKIRKHLQPLYAVVDAAHEPSVLRTLMESTSEHISLFEGEAAARLAHFAPYLVRLPPGSALLEALVRGGWGKGWGVYFASSAAPHDLLAFLRRLLVTHLPDGTGALLRFYDPRVLRVLLPSITPAQQRHLFGPIRFFLMEAEDPSLALGFSLSARGLERVELPLAGAQPPSISLVVHGSSASLYPARAGGMETEHSLHLRDEQVRRLGAAERNAFADTVVAELRERYPERFEDLGEVRMRALVEYGSKRPHRYGIRAQPEIRRYIALMVELGQNFDTDPRFPWAAELLGRRLPPATKLRKLAEAAKPYVDVPVLL